MKIEDKIFEQFKLNDCLTTKNEIPLKNLIHAIVYNEPPKVQIEFPDAKPTPWHNYEFLVEKDIKNLFQALSGKPPANSDLNLKWFQFTGSTLANSRPMCIAMTERRYFHISEIPDLIKGFVAGKKYSTEGMWPCTNEKNYLILGNGRGCPHDLLFIIMLPENIPIDLKNKFK